MPGAAARGPGSLIRHTSAPQWTMPTIEGGGPDELRSSHKGFATSADSSTEKPQARSRKRLSTSVRHFVLVTENGLNSLPHDWYGLKGSRGVRQIKSGLSPVRFPTNRQLIRIEASRRVYARDQNRER